MAEAPRAVPAHTELFQLCIHFSDTEDHWREFVRRFNPLLARSIGVAWRRNGQGEWPPVEVAPDLLQDVYVAILKNEFRLLRNYRGSSDAEAEAYLAHTAINQTISYLRKQAALKNAADEVSLEELFEGHGDAALPGRPAARLRKISDHEFQQALEHCFSGANSKRDILLLLLHVREGYEVSELARLGLCDLQESSLYNLMRQMKSRLREFFSSHV